MALDIYVGSFTRYLSGRWETVAQRTARELGIGYTAFRPPVREGTTDPEMIHWAIIGWREEMSRSLRATNILQEELAWSETVDTPYYTESLTWDCYQAVLTLAAYEEAGAAPPHEISGEWRADPLLAQRLRLREALRYGVLFGPDMWLPAEFSVDTFMAPAPTNGQNIGFGSCRRLHESLEELIQRTYGGSPDQWNSWRNLLPEARDRRLEPAAKAGMSILLTLSDQARADRLPMVLDL